MEYERIDKSQNGIISPNKLRMKLLGISPKKIKEGSNCSSSRTSPSSRLEDSDFNSSLLASSYQDLDDSVSSPKLPSEKLCSESATSYVQNNFHNLPKENIDASHIKLYQPSRGDNSNSSAVHPNEDDNLDYDSNASSSSFEFHKGGERVGHRSSLTRSLSRPTSYKWNDAEKWIMNKQAVQAIYSTKNHSGYDRRPPTVRVTETKKVDICQQPVTQVNLERFSFAQSNVHIDLCPRNKDLDQVGNVTDLTHDVGGTPAIREISMRDMGTEMTPVTSQEPSRTSTPMGATTPLRSPPLSIPSTPRRGNTVESTTNSNSHNSTQKGNKDLSEKELKLKTRSEIVALGIQLGKMSIAAWASTDEKEKRPSSPTHQNELEHIENEKHASAWEEAEKAKHIETEKRASAWEEAEKAKHAARYKREDIKIQAWESQQKAKLEEELRRIEAKVEQLRTKSQAKMVKQITLVRNKSEEKRTASEVQKKREAEKAAAKAEYIRQTGRIPPSEFVCCGLF